MIRKAILGSLLALVPVAALASNPVAESIAATVRVHLERRGALQDWENVRQIMIRRSDRYFSKGKNDWFDSDSWFETAAHLLRDNGHLPMTPFAGWPTQVAEGECFGLTCRIDDPNDPDFVQELADSLLKGARVIQNCWQLRWEETESGNYIRVPSVVLPTGKPIRRDKQDPSYFSGGRYLAGNRLDHADSELAAILWGIHLRNIGLPKERWGGCAHVFRRDNTSFGCSYYDPPYRDLSNRLVIPSVENVRGNQNGNFWLTNNIGNGPGTSKECPEADGGSDFDFYSFSSTGESSPFNTQDSCTWYSKNFSLSASGYGYPETVVVPINTLELERAHRHNGMGYQCPLSREFIRALSSELFKYATDASDYTGPEYEPILLSEVRIGSAHPLGRDLAAAPATLWPEAPPVGPEPEDVPGVEPADYTPPPANAPGASPGNGGQDGDTTGNVNPGNIDFSSPTVDDPEFEAPDIGLIDWLPGFSNLVLDNSDAQCPVFSFEAFGETFAMDSFCSTLEDWRAPIAAIMLVTFTMMSYAIVLRA